MKGATRRLHVVVPLVMLALALVVRFQAPGFVERLQFQVFDAYQQLRPRPYTPVPVKIVDVDEESLERVGQWPWPRTRLAELIERIFDGGAAVVAVDVLLAEPDRTSPANVLPLWPSTPEIERIRRDSAALPDHDALLAETIARHPVVTGYLLTQRPSERLPERKWTVAIDGHDPRPFLPSFAGAITSLPPIDHAASGNGSVNLVPEPDNIVRRLHLFFRIDDTLYPSLAAEALRVAQGAATYVIRTSGAESEPGFGARTGINTVKIGSLAVPTDAEGRVWLRYTRATPARYVSAWRVLDSDFDASALDGHLVVLGTSAAGLKDLRATPLDPVTPGVEVHASLLEQALLGDFLRRPDWVEGAELIYLLVLGAVLILLLPGLGAIACALLGAGAVAVAAGISWYAYAELGWLIDPVGPSLLVLLLFLTGSLINYAQTEAERRHVREAFGHYLAPAVIERLMSDPSRLVLGGEKRETTFLFTDIAGFTSVSEKAEPTLLVRLLNDYLDGACSIVLPHGGTIDKIVGDALHVMFNAPSDQPDHAERAVACALELDAFCQSYADRQAEAGIALGETRIGVNTGTTVVGNFGGTARFDYTAHGDAINTAARLEGANRYLGTRICASAATVERCPHFRFRPIGRLVLKGKTEGIEVFEPLGDSKAGDGMLAAYLEAYALLDTDGHAAVAAFSDLAERYPDDPLVRFHAQRLAAGGSGRTIVMTEK